MRAMRPAAASLAGCIITSTAGRTERSEEHTSELQSQSNLVCRLLLEKKKRITDLIVVLFRTTHTHLYPYIDNDQTIIGLQMLRDDCVPTPKHITVVFSRCSYTAHGSYDL